MKGKLGIRGRGSGTGVYGTGAPQPQYLCYHLDRHLGTIARMIHPVGAANLAPLLAWAGFNSSGFGGARFGGDRLKRLIKRLECNPHGNFYHNAWHSAAVVVAAALLSRCAGLSRHAHQTLLLLALTHDLDHRGRWASHKQGVEEKRSATIALRLLCPLWSASGRWRHQFTQSIIATDPTCALEGKDLDEVTALLLDADIFASIFLPQKTALRLTRAVIRENTSAADTSAADTSAADTSAVGNTVGNTNPQPLKTAAVFEEFLAYAARRGFKHHATRSLARSTRNRTPAVLNHPHHAKKLGFTIAPCR